jgi:glycine/D-amino acid oxidase-like deaminating enzyme
MMIPTERYQVHFSSETLPFADATLSNIPVWEDNSWRELPQLDRDVEADVCVVGLGGSGLACVNELRRLGASVVGIDAAMVGGGAAGRNGGFLLAGAASFYHDAVKRLGHERALAIYRLTIAEIERMIAETPQAIRRTGSLRIAFSEEEAEDCRAQLAAMRADDLPAEWYEGAEGRGLLIPTDGSYNPLLRCRLLARAALDAGALLFERSPAVALSGNEVRTPLGGVRCKRAIVAVDGNLDRILPELAGRVRTARLQMLATAPTDEVRFTRPVYARWGYEYWQQLPDGRIALGGFRDRAGDAEWTSTGDPTDAVQQMLERFLRDDLHVRAPITHRWGAPVAFTESRLPIIEEVREGVWAIGGYSGTGNVIGAICGRAAAQLAVEGTSLLSDSDQSWWSIRVQE